MSEGETPPRKKRAQYHFNPQWGPALLFREKGNGAECVKCFKVISVAKRFNLNRHCEAKHTVEYGSVTDPLERAALFKQLQEQSKDSVDQATEEYQSAAAVRASYKVAFLIAKKFKCFSEGEFVKECTVAIAEVMFPQEVDALKGVSLSRPTITRRIVDMSQDLDRQLQERCDDFIAYSLALDESTDVVDTAQLAIFVRGVNQDLEVTEEMLDLVGMKGTTTGNDIFEALEEAVESSGLDWQLLASVATDGAPAMRGHIQGLVGRVNTKVASIGKKSKVLAIHCFLHRENLCSQSLEMSHVMKIVVKTVNSIRSHGLKHRQFREFLHELEVEYHDVPYFTEVRWLSRGKVLERFFLLREEISMFMGMQGTFVQELDNPIWHCDLAFLCDICGHLNTLNVVLQGRNKIITNMVDTVRAFMAKLSLWIQQFEAGQVIHFENLKSREGKWSILELQRYKQGLIKLKSEFEERFKDLSDIEMELQIFATPFAVQSYEAPHDLQLELIDLQCDREMMEQFRTKKSIEGFYKGFPQEKFPRLHKLAAKVLSLFGTTYCCEQFFSLMKLNKPRLRNFLSDSHLKASLRIASAQSMTPDISSLVNARRCQKSGQQPLSQSSTSSSV